MQIDVGRLSISGWRENGPPNGLELSRPSQQPTACRSLARRFRGSCFVGLGVSAACT